jgi:hypothetical protein
MDGCDAAFFRGDLELADERRHLIRYLSPLGIQADLADLSQRILI